MSGWIAWLVLLWLPAAGIVDLDGRPAEDPETEYYYRFDSPQLEIIRSELRFNERGAGTFRFQGKEQEDAITAPLGLLPETMLKIERFLSTLRFLESQEDYQGDRSLSYLGISTIRIKKGSRTREAVYNYTRNPAARDLASLLRSITYQEQRTFTIDVARDHDPLDLDRQLRTLDREIRNGWFPEPKKLLEKRKSIASDPDLLMMVRRRADSLIGSLEKIK
ncbi:MAG: hypothetical protein HY650_15415 [Acidobacteria bacterium]|nr:hypothetical protein [Acidobacteriota bacterium]